jgi:transcriptional regulator with XRE-family HTH domain
MRIARHKMKKGSKDNFERLLAQESLILEVTEEICRVLQETKMSRQELAKRLGKSKGFVTQVLSGDRNMTLRTAADLATALDHRLQVRAVPTEIRASPQTPFNFPVAVLQKQMEGAGLAQLGVIAAGWNEVARRAGEAPMKDSSIGRKQWAPATQAVECEGPQQANIPDHEFSLSA